MNKPEYSDLYKFIVSLGLILIAFAFLLPWLFLKESFDTLVTVTDLANLTPTAQTLIAYRQNTALWFIQNIIWLSSIPAIIGVFCLGSGLFLWQRKQKTLDKKDELETEKLGLEIKNMTPAQIAVKAIQETTTDEILRGGLFQSPKPEISPAYDSDEKYRIEAINEYFQIENFIVDKLANCYGKDNVRANQQLDDSQIDVLVNIGRNKRLVFEIKLIRNPDYIQRRIREITKTLNTVISKYNESHSGSNTYGVGLMIIPNEYPKELDIQAINHWIERETKNTNIQVQILTLTEQQLKDISCANFRDMLKTTYSKD